MKPGCAEAGGSDGSEKSSMATPDRATMAERLKELLDRLSEFKSKPFHFASEPVFETWRSEVLRWLDKAGSFAGDEGWAFSNISFSGDRGDLRLVWKAALQES